MTAEYFGLALASIKEYKNFDKLYTLDKPVMTVEEKTSFDQNQKNDKQGYRARNLAILLDYDDDYQGFLRVINRAKEMMNGSPSDIAINFEPTTTDLKYHYLYNDTPLHDKVVDDIFLSKLAAYFVIMAAPKKGNAIYAKAYAASSNYGLKF